MKNQYKKNDLEYKRKNKYNIFTDKNTKRPLSISHINNNNEAVKSNFLENKENNKEKYLSEVNKNLKSLIT